MAVVLMGSVIVPGDTTFHDMRLKDLNLQNVEFIVKNLTKNTTITPKEFGYPCLSKTQ